MTVFNCTVVYYYMNTYYIELYYDWETFFHSYFLSANGRPGKLLCTAENFNASTAIFNNRGKNILIFPHSHACIQSFFEKSNSKNI